MEVWDLSLLRTFKVTAGSRLQVRVEAFNLPNHPIWNDPDTTLLSPRFGQISSTRKPMRELQFGVKYMF